MSYARSVVEICKQRHFCLIDRNRHGGVNHGSNASAEFGRKCGAPTSGSDSTSGVGATLEQAKDGPELVSATGATTWIEFAAGS